MFCFTDLLIKQTISHHPWGGRSRWPRPRHLAPGPPGQWSVSPVRTSGGKINTWAGDCLWSPAPTLLTTGGAPGGWHVTLATIRVAISHSSGHYPLISDHHHDRQRPFLCFLCLLWVWRSLHSPPLRPLSTGWAGWPYLETPSHITTQQHQPQAKAVCSVPQARRYQGIVKIEVWRNVYGRWEISLLFSSAAQMIYQ